MLEQFVLFGYIVSGILFLATAYCRGTRSFWNMNRPRYIVLKTKIVKNVWLDRSSSDFMNYLKFEWTQYSYFGSLLIGCLVNMPFLNQMLSCQPMCH